MVSLILSRVLKKQRAYYKIDNCLLIIDNHYHSI